MAIFRTSTRSLLLLLQILQLLVAVLGNPAEKDFIPHFDYSRQAIYVLNGTLPWVPARTTMIAFGQADKPIQIHLDSLAGHEDSLYSKSKSLNLMFKCSSEDSEFQQITLVSRSVSQHLYETDQFCEGKDRRKFKLQKLNSSFHALNLLEPTNISFEQSLKHLMEFKVRAEFTEMDMNSSSLFIYSVDSVFNINNLQTTSGGFTYKRYFLTDEAIQLLTGRISTTGEPLVRVNFLEKKLVDQLLKAPLLIKNYLSINVDMSCIGTSCLANSSVVLTTENADMFHDYYNRFNRKGADISSQSGAMHVVGSDVYNALNLLVGSRVRVTLRLSLSKFGSMFANYNLTKTVMEFHHVKKYPTKSGINKCFVDHNGTEEQVSLFVGTEQGANLDCPIVCSDNRPNCLVYFNGKLCKSAKDGTPGEYFLFCSNYHYSWLNPSAVVFHMSLQKNRPFQIAFAMESLKYAYKISVIEMPLFYTVQLDQYYHRNPGLPPVTYAILGKKVSFNCTMSHSFLDSDHVEMSAHIQLIDTSVPQLKWIELSPEAFAVKILKKSPASVVQKTLHANYSHTLLVELPHVTKAWSALQMALLCRVSVTKRDAQKLLGVPQYETETRTNVVFVGSRHKRTCPRANAMPGVLLALLLLSEAIVALLDRL